MVHLSMYYGMGLLKEQWNGWILEVKKTPARSGFYSLLSTGGRLKKGAYFILEGYISHADINVITPGWPSYMSSAPLPMSVQCLNLQQL